MLCVVRYRPLRRADLSSRGVLPSVFVSTCVFRWNHNPQRIQQVDRISTTKKISHTRNLCVIVRDVIYWPGHSAYRVQTVDRILCGHYKPCYRQEIWPLQFQNRRAVPHCDIPGLNGKAYVQTQKSKSWYQTWQLRQPVPPTHGHFWRLTSMHQQKRRTITKEWHPHKKNAQKHTCRQYVLAVLK